MAYITPQTQSLKLCFQSHYSLPYFQREYKWESRHFEEMLNDVQRAFLSSYDPTHGRKDVANYAPYFLGSIITSSELDGKRPLIDGQQRLTSSFLLLAYLERFRRDNAIPNAADLSTLLGNVSYGSMDYAIEFPESRKTLFDRYLDFDKSADDALGEAEELPNLNDGDLKLLAAIRSSDKLLEVQVRNVIAHFIDYVVERVLLIDIAVASESEAHRVFVTMNDRGLRLGPIDLLKGQILSKITDPAEAQKCHSVWVKTLNALREDDPEEDSLFFRNLFRAKWAETMRGKNKGDVAGDFDLVGDSYHRWFEANASKMGIVTADDYAKFAGVTIPKFADVYRFIKAAEATLKAGSEHIFYNSARKYSFQPMVLMAAVEEGDSPTEWQGKVQFLARLVDLILTTRTIEGKENNYDNLKDLSFSMTKEVRNKSLQSLQAYVRAEWPRHVLSLDGVAKMKYKKADRSDMLYVLARIAVHLEDAFHLTSKVSFPTYWQRDRGGKTFDIEHLLKDKFDPSVLPANHGFADSKDYMEARDSMGALALLHRSRNRSLRDKAYKEKLPAYSSDNVLVQTLTAGFYQNHPNVTSFLGQNSTIKLKHIPDFTKNDIEERGSAYVELAKAVWKQP